MFSFHYEAGAGRVLPKEKTFLESELSLMRKEMEVKNFESEVLSFAGF